MKQVGTQQPHSEPPKQRVMAAITAFLTKYRKPLLFTIAGMAVVVVGLVVVLSIQNSRNEAALEAVEDLQDDFQEWSDLADEEQVAEYEALATAARAIIDGHPRTYAAARARILDARALFALERWTDAVERYLEVAELRSDTYLAPTALMDAAVALESAGETSRALELHQRIVDEYAGESAEVPRALFSIGRIHETEDRATQAADAYRRLIDDYPASSWTNLARNRIITLTVEGRIGG